MKFVLGLLMTSVLFVGCEDASDSQTLGDEHNAAATEEVEAKEQRKVPTEAERTAKLQAQYWTASGYVLKAFDSSQSLSDKVVVANKFCEYKGKPKLPNSAQKFFEICEAVDAVEQHLATEPMQPIVPEKPVYEKPEYTGVVKISGTLRGPYTDGGIILQKGSSFYLLEDGAMPRSPFVTRLNGFVEHTGRTITLAIGRDGRETAVVKVSDQETYRDDQRTHRENVAAAKKVFKEEQADYAEQMKLVKAYDAARATYEKELARLETSLAPLIEELHAAYDGPALD